MSESPPAPASLVGTSLGSYRLVRLLGSGGMGSVYEGVHPVIGARVAIKVLNREVAGNPVVVERFFNEARAVNLIGHRNLVKILDLAQSAGQTYCLMELLEGEPLSARLAAGVPMPFAEAAPILIQCAEALQAAHERAIVHRDVKPDNIFLTSEEGRADFVKILDFGIAKLAAPGLETVRTAAGVVMGTPAFMSPEQAEGAADKIDGRSDVYSLGVVMFQMATGLLPFREPTYVRVMMAHLSTLPPRPSVLAPLTPLPFERIILRCLAKQREERYQTMRALREALVAAQAELASAAPAVTLPTLEPAAASPFPPAVPILGSGQPDEPLPGAEMFEPRPAAPEPAPAPPPRAPPQPTPEEPLELDLERSPGPAPAPVDDAPPPPAPGSRKLALVIAALAAVSCAGLAWLLLAGRAAPDATAADRAPAPAAAAPAAALPAVSPPAAEARPGAERPAAAEPEREDLRCPQRPARPVARPTALQLVTVPAGARVRAQWDAGGCAVGTTPFQLVVPLNARLRLEYRLAGRPKKEAEVVADGPQVILESLAE